MAKLSAVALSDAERLLLQQTIKKGKAPARTTTRARILLKADAGPEGPEWTDTKFAGAVAVSRPTIERLRKRAVTEGRRGRSAGSAQMGEPTWQARWGAGGAAHGVGV